MSSAPAAGEAPEAPARRKRRRWPWVLLGLFLLCLVLVWAGLRWLMRPVPLAERLGALARETSGFPLSMARVEHQGLSSFRILDLSLGEPERMLSIGRIELGLQPWRLLDRELVLDSLVIEDLHLQLVWQDSLLLPDWLAAEEPAEAAEDSPENDRSSSLPAWLGIEKSRLRPGHAILRSAVVGIEFRGQGESQFLESPPLSLRLDLPDLAGPQIEELLAGKLPADLRAALLLGWSGDWLPRPAFADLMEDLRLHLPDEARQQVDWQSGLAGDSLRLGMTWSLEAPGLALERQGRRRALPDEFSCRMELHGDLAARSLDSLALDWSLAPFGGSGGLQLQLAGMEGDSPWRLSLQHGLEPGALLPLAEAFADLPAGLDLDPGRLELELELSGRLAEDGLPAQADLELDQSLRLPRLGHPLGRLDSLDQQLSLRGQVDLKDPQASRALRLELGLQLQQARPDLEALLDSAQRSLLPPAFQQGAFRQLDWVSSWQAEQLFGPSRLKGDLALTGPLDRPWYLSLDAALPPLEELQAGELPQGRVDLALEELPLAALDPRLQGEISLGGWTRLDADGLALELQVMPTRWNLQLEPEATPIEIPFYDLVLRGSLEDPLGERWQGQLSLQASPFPALEMDLDLDPAGGGSLEASFRELNLALVQRRLPAELIVLNELRGSFDLLASVALDSSWMPARADLAFDFGQIRARSGRLLEVEQLRLAGGGSWTPQSAELEGSLYIGEVRSSELPEAIQRVHASWSAAMDPALRLEAQAQIPTRNLLLVVDGHADSLAALPRSQWTLQALLNNPDHLLEPWPGLALQGNLDAGAVLDVGDSLQTQLQAWLAGSLQELRYEELVQLRDARLDLALSQALDLRQAPFLKAGTLREPPADWNRPLAFGRGTPGVGSLSPRGWSLWIGEVEAQGWSMQELAMDLRMAEGRVDCPQMQARAYGGTIAGSFHLAVPEDLLEPEYALELWASGLDSRRFRFHREEEAGLFDRKQSDRLDLVMSLEGGGIDLSALDRLRGRIRLPEPGRRVTLNLLYALDERGSDPTIRRIRKLLELPGFRYSVDGLDFDLAHGFVKPRVALRKSFLSPLPDVVLPMSPLPLGFMVKTFALTEKELP